MVDPDKETPKLDGSDEWKEANIGRWPRGWRLNFPKHFSIQYYLYITPKANTQ